MLFVVLTKLSIYAIPPGTCFIYIVTLDMLDAANIWIFSEVFFSFFFFNNEGVALIGSECKHRNETILGIHFHEYSTAGNQLDQDKAWQIENITGVYIRQLCAY